MDLAKFMGWSTLAMAQRYTRHEDQERALRAHRELWGGKTALKIRHHATRSLPV